MAMKKFSQGQHLFEGFLGHNVGYGFWQIICKGPCKGYKTIKSFKLLFINLCKQAS